MTAKQTTKAPRPPTDLTGLCHAITEHAPLPMATVEGATHIVRYANPAFCRLMNKPSEELLGKRLSELLSKKDQCVTLLDRVFRTGKSESFTEQENSQSHPIFWSYTVWPVREDEGLVGIMIQVTETAKVHQTTRAMNEALILGSLRQHELTEAADASNAQLHEEIGERKLTEAALYRAQGLLRDRAGQLEGLVTERTSELTTTNTQLEAFAYSVAHDLRAPLRSIQGFSAMLVEEAGETLSKTGKDYANRINKSAQFMDALLSDLLAFSRISQQRVKLTSINLKTVVESVLSRLEKDIQDKHARVDSPGLWLSVLAHEPTLAQVLSNLISNALKFSPPGASPQIRLRVEERQSSNNPIIQQSNNPAPPAASPVAWVRIWVEDDGIGIAPEHQVQIFGLFTRLEGEKYAGTGIGLAIVQKGVERMGGRVGVESAPGQGSCFWFELRKA